MISPGDWVLAVDFGTTNTVAAVTDARGTTTLMVDGRQVTPSAVFLNPDRKTWSVGDTAIRTARRRLEWFDPNPKRGVPDGALFLGGQNVPVGDAITAVLRPIIQEAASQHGGRRPAAFVVTHPANWGEARVSILVEAAATAALRGWPPPQPLSEPVAAAQAILGMEDIPQQARVVVLDLGGGTVDATVVDRDGDELTVVGHPQGRDGIGGEDYDERLARWMTAEVGAPGLYDRLASSAEPEERERAVEIRSDARNVKEQLSRQAAVPAQLPASPPELPEITPVMVNRTQLEDLIRGGPGHDPGLTESVEVVNSVLDQVPPGPPFAGVFLTGGCSRIPLLGALVQERTGRPPLTYGDPTTAVAQGAGQTVWKRLVNPAPRPDPQPRPAEQSVPLRQPPPDPVPPRRPADVRRLVILGVAVAAAAAVIVAVILGSSHSHHNIANPTPPPTPSTTTPVTPTTPVTTPPTTPDTTPPTTPATTAPVTTAPPVSEPLDFNFTDSSQYPCSAEGTLHSTTGSPISFAFVNDTSESLQIIWLNESGNRVTYDTLPSDETYTVNTYTNQAWMIATMSAECTGIFGTNGDGGVTITQQ
jgi:molecular chaperone DnaK